MSGVHCGWSTRLPAALTMLLFSLACDSTRKSVEKDAPPAAADPRTAVPLPADGQQAVLREMRGMLGAIGGAMSGAARSDTSAVLAALAPAGTAAAADPALESMLPTKWKELAESTHGGFDTLATSVRHARSGQALKDTVLVGIARISGSCNACHEAFRVTVQ